MLKYGPLRAEAIGAGLMAGPNLRPVRLGRAAVDALWRPERVRSRRGRLKQSLWLAAREVTSKRWADADPRPERLPSQRDWQTPTERALLG